MSYILKFVAQEIIEDDDGGYEMEQFGEEFEIERDTLPEDGFLDGMRHDVDDAQYVICDTPFPVIVDENDNVIKTFNTEKMEWE